MARRTFTNASGLDALLRANERVVRHAELTALGMSASTICWRIGPHGPSQRALPGVVIAHRGVPTRRERLLAALKYAGDGAVVIGMAALREHGVRVAAKRAHRPHFLVPHRRQITSHGFVVVERTRRLPDAGRRHGLAIAPARQRTALTREVLREIDAGIPSVAEAKVRRAVQARGLPEMEWNIELFTADGDFVGVPDGYWVDLAVALQIDSVAWHLGPEKYRRTQARARTFGRHHVLVLAVAPTDALDDVDQLVRDLEGLREQARQRPVPDLVARRPAA